MTRLNEAVLLMEGPALDLGTRPAHDRENVCIAAVRTSLWSTGQWFDDVNFGG
jgi:hypothetical protein